MAGVIGGGALLLVLVAALKDADLKNQLAETGYGDIGLIHNLGIALFNDYVDIAHFLVDHGADVTAHDTDGSTPLHRASFNVPLPRVEQGW